MEERPLVPYPLSPRNDLKTVAPGRVPARWVSNFACQVLIPGAIFFVFALAGCGGAGGSGDEPPAADATAVIEASTYSGTPPLAVTFDGSASSAREGTIVSYVWDLGDGTQEVGPVVVHTYSVAGTYQVRLVVTTSELANAETGASIVVSPAAGAPHAAIAASAYSGLGPLAVTFSGAGSTDTNGAIVAYQWNFGDGSTSTAVAPSHTFAAGVHTVTLTVTDNDGATDQEQTVIAAASWDEEVVRLTNAERWNYASSHLPPLKAESHLAAAALRHSTES